MDKICIRCKRLLPLTEFHKKANVKDGHQTYCKTCNSNQVLHNYRTNTKYRDNCKKRMNQQYAEIKSSPTYHEQKTRIYKKYRSCHKEKFAIFWETRKELDKLGLRQKIWDRTNGHCESCNNQLTKHNYAIHHLNEDRHDNREDNLKLLCVTCHLHKYHHSPQKYK